MNTYNSFETTFYYIYFKVLQKLNVYSVHIVFIMFTMYALSHPHFVLQKNCIPVLKEDMPIILIPRAQPEVVHFLMSNESLYFSICKSKI